MGEWPQKGQPSGRSGFLGSAAQRSGCMLNLIELAVPSFPGGSRLQALARSDPQASHCSPHKHGAAHGSAKLQPWSRKLEASTLVPTKLTLGEHRLDQVVHGHHCRAGQGRQDLLRGALSAKQVVYLVRWVRGALRGSGPGFLAKKYNCVSDACCGALHQSPRAASGSASSAHRRRSRARRRSAGQLNEGGETVCGCAQRGILCGRFTGPWADCCSCGGFGSSCSDATSSLTMTNVISWLIKWPTGHLDGWQKVGIRRCQISCRCAAATSDQASSP